MHGLTTVQGSHVKENEASILSLSLSLPCWRDFVLTRSRNKDLSKSPPHLWISKNVPSLKSPPTLHATQQSSVKSPEQSMYSSKRNVCRFCLYRNGK
jgi:hypothetical protein